MKQKNELVAVYGTLLEGEYNAHWGKGAFSRRKASVRGVLFDTGCGYPAFVPGAEGGPVEAEVLEVDAGGLDKMDWLEDYPRLYRRERVVATYEDGTKAEVWVYVMNNLPEQAKVIATGSWRRRNEKPAANPAKSVTVEIDLETLVVAHGALCALVDAVEGVLSETGDIGCYSAHTAKMLGDAERAKDGLADAIGGNAGKAKGGRAPRRKGR